MGSTGWNFHLAGIDKDLREDAAHPAHNTGALHTPGPWPRPVKTLVPPGPGHILEKQEKDDFHAGDWDRRPSRHSAAARSRILRGHVEAHYALFPLS